jgi:[ribosomal protein S5]-alanine N-acetyltransferase
MASNWLKLQEFPLIETSRLALREIEELDFQAFYSLFRDSKVNKHIELDWADPIQGRKSFDSFRARFHEGSGIRWSIVLKQTGEWVGNFGFRSAKGEGDTVERGLQIASAYWRKGYGLEASQGAMDWLRRSSRYKKVDAWIAVGNLGAIRLVQKQGFQATGEQKPFKSLTHARFIKDL